LRRHRAAASAVQPHQCGRSGRGGPHDAHVPLPPRAARDHAGGVRVLWVFLGILLAGILIGLPISFSLGLAAVVMMFLMDVSAAVVVEQAIRGVNSFPLLAIPFFILVG